MERCQWVKTELIKAFPRILSDRGADVNKSGRIDPKERLHDFDQNGILGNVEDFKHYYLNLQKEINQSVPFFRWAANFDPGKLKLDNPIHDLLSIESEVVPAQDVEAAYRFLAGALIAARKRTKDNRAMSLFGKVFEVFGALIVSGIKYKKSYRQLFTDDIKAREMVCDTSSFAVLGIAHQMGIRNLYAVVAPSHIFLRQVRGASNTGFELRKNNLIGVTSDELYIKEYLIPKISIQNGVYMKNLSYQELLSLYCPEMSVQFWPWSV